MTSQDPPSPPWVGSSLVAVAALAVIAASCMLGVQTAWLPDDAALAFFRDNRLGAGVRGLLLLTVGGAALGAAVLGGSSLLWKRRRAGLVLLRLARVCAPLSLTAFVPALLQWQLSDEKQTFSLLLLALFVLALERLLAFVGRGSTGEGAAEWTLGGLRPAWAQALLRWRGWPWLVVTTAALAYTAYFSRYTILHHQRLETRAFDLGIFDNTLYSALHGSPFYSSVMNGRADVNILSCHAEYAMLAFVPLYALWPGPEFLLVLQAAFLGLAAIPLFMFARTRLPERDAVILALVYLMFAPLHGANFYDFHWLPLAIPFHYFLYWAIATRRTKFAVIMVIALFSLREDIPLGLFFLGVFLAVTREWTRFGVWLAIASAVFFVVNKFVIMASIGRWWFENIYVDLFADGKRGYGSVLKTLLSNPVYALGTLQTEGKLIYFLHMLAPLAFLPLRGRALWLLLVPGFFFTLLTTKYPATISIAFQYTTHWIPYLFLAIVLALHRRRAEATHRSHPRAVLGAIACGVLSHSYNHGAVLQHERFIGGFSAVRFDFAPGERERYEQMAALLAPIPEDASVAATETLTPHISTRVHAYPLRFDVGAPDYFLLRAGEMGGQPRQLVTDGMNQRSYRLFGRVGSEIFLFGPGEPDEATRVARRELGISLKADEAAQ